MSGDGFMVGMPIVKIGGGELPDTAAGRLRQVEVDLSMHRTSSATILLDDPSLQLLDAGDLSSVKVGAVLTVSATTGDATAVLVFTGRITGVRAGMAGDGQGTTFVEITAHAGGHRLRHSLAPVSSTNEKVGDIVDRVAVEAGLKASITGRVASAMTTHLLPTGTAEQLLDQLATLHDADWWTDGDELRFAQREAATPTLSIDRSADMHDFEIGLDASDAPQSVTLRGSDDQQKDVVGSSEMAKLKKDVSGMGTNAKFVTDSLAGAAKEFKIASGVRSPTEDGDFAESAARSVHGRLARAGLRMRVTTDGAPKASIGGCVELTGLGKRMSGTYMLTDVQHHFAETYTSVLACEPPPRAAHGDDVLLAKLSLGASSWSTSGATRGIVTDIADPTGAGRVLVRFPSLGGEMSSTWARIAAPGAGPGRGLDLRPAVEDEVLVLFEGGDPSLAVVVGGLWSKGREHVNRTAELKSAEEQSQSLRGHNGGQLTFHGSKEDDTWSAKTPHELPTAAGAKSENGVSLVAGSKVGGGTLLLGDKVVLHGVGNDVIVGNDNASLTFKENGDLTIECEKLTIKAAQKSEIASQQDLLLKAGTKAVVKGGSAAEVEGAKVTVKGMGGVDVKSAKVAIGP